MGKGTRAACASSPLGATCRTAHRLGATQRHQVCHVTRENCASETKLSVRHLKMLRGLATTQMEMLAIIGITGPNDPIRHAYLRQAWARQSSKIVIRFVVSIEDSASNTSVARDVVQLSCLGQSAGSAVVELALADAWYRYAVTAYAHESYQYIGRADTDLAMSPAWLSVVLSSAQQQQQHGEPSHQYLGRVQWFSWHREEARPVGWGGGPLQARMAAQEEFGAHENGTSALAGPFPFVTGPLILLSTSLARWYSDSTAARYSLAAAIESRRIVDGRGGGSAITTTTATTAAAQTSTASATSTSSSRRFRSPRHAGDIHVRLFDDVFLGYNICLGGAPK